MQDYWGKKKKEKKSVPFSLYLLNPKYSLAAVLEQFLPDLKDPVGPI